MLARRSFYLRHSSAVEAIAVKQQVTDLPLLEALTLLDSDPTIHPDATSYGRLLRECTDSTLFHHGRRIHEHIVRTGLGDWLFLRNNIITMYSKCGSLEDAYNVFCSIQCPNRVSWNVMIAAYAHHHQYHHAVLLFRRMQLEGIYPSKITLITTLNACSDPAFLSDGRLIHRYMEASRLLLDVVAGTAVLNMYGKCRSLEHAISAFDTMPVRNVVSWNAMISIYSQSGFNIEAKHHFLCMQLEGISSNNVTFISVLNACSDVESMVIGKQIHACIDESSSFGDPYVESALLNMYCKCGHLEEARAVFDQMNYASEVPWNIMISAYAQSEDSLQAFKLFQLMRFEGFVPEQVTFLSILDACHTAEQCFYVHGYVRDVGLEFRTVVGTALVNAYAKCGCPEEASAVFEQISERTVVTWSSIAMAYADRGRSCEALQYFRQMQSEGMTPNRITFLSLLNAFTNSTQLAEVKQFHALITELGLESETALSNALVNAYGKCGSSDQARHVFDRLQKPNIVSWNGMIGIYVQEERNEEAVHLFRKMQLQGMLPDKVNFITVLGACVGSSESDEAIRRLVHACVVENGCLHDVFVMSAMMNMYGKCGDLANMKRLLEEIDQPDVPMWNVVIASYGLHGQSRLALRMYQKMQADGRVPDKITFISILNACSDLTLLAEGRLIHSHILECHTESDVVVANALANMYAKCGRVIEARKMFDRLPMKSAVSWNGLIQSYAQHGHAEDVFKVTWQMEQDGTKSNSITFISILSACSHAGLIEEGCRYFSSMLDDDIAVPADEHYGCMVDLLSRVGHLDKAEEYILKMKEQSIVAWTTLLGAARVHDDMERGERAAHKLFELDPLNVTVCVVLSNIYAAKERWKDVKMISERMAKMLGCNSIQIKNKVHEVEVTNQKHSEICASLYKQMKGVGDHIQPHHHLYKSREKEPASV